MNKLFSSAAMLLATGLLAQNTATSSINDFAFRYFNQYTRTASTNSCISPLSINMAFGMAYAGASGETAAEFRKVFGFGSNDDAFHKTFGDFASRIEKMNKPGSALSLANKIYYEKNFSFLPEFFTTVKSNYGVSPEIADFKKDADGERKKINRWVEKQTHDRIRDLLPEGSLNDLTRMVLVNALYMKSRWASVFDTSATYDQTFYTDGLENSKRVKMMHQTSSYATASDNQFDIIELPYQGDSLSMLILLPAGKKNLKDVREKCTNDYYSKINDRLHMQKVSLSLPKFKSSFGLKMSSDLEKMGMKQSFSDAADFTKMRKERDICISEAYHQTFVEVNETGTEAAAATAVVMIETTSIAPMYKTFTVDHPFIYIIREKATGTIFFIGEVQDPSAR